MAHPKMFDDADPVLQRLAEVCLALPGADMKISHGRPAFFTTKIFVVYGAVTKGGTDASRHDQAMIVLAEPDERAALEADDRFFTPAYWGPYGWIGLDLAADVDWEEVAELVETSYRQTAPARRVAELDRRD